MSVTLIGTIGVARKLFNIEELAPCDILVCTCMTLGGSTVDMKFMSTVLPPGVIYCQQTNNIMYVRVLCTCELKYMLLFFVVYFKAIPYYPVFGRANK